MKYLLTALRHKNTQLILENVVPAKTSHIHGYGLGVTLSSTAFGWYQSSTFMNIRLVAFSEPTVIPQ